MNADSTITHYPSAINTVIIDHPIVLLFSVLMVLLLFYAIEKKII